MFSNYLLSVCISQVEKFELKIFFNLKSGINSGLVTFIVQFLENWHDSSTSLLQVPVSANLFVIRLCFELIAKFNEFQNCFSKQNSWKVLKAGLILQQSEALKKLSETKPLHSILVRQRKCFFSFSFVTNF